MSLLNPSLRRYLRASCGVRRCVLSFTSLFTRKRLPGSLSDTKKKVRRTPLTMIATSTQSIGFINDRGHPWSIYRVNCIKVLFPSVTDSVELDIRPQDLYQSSIH
ncbi:hypothetical protein KSF78_0007078 [Schistosoma japonicum]|nr:hypothetical protein KSF78_0007078 [Schistosoma japonicum]